MPDDLTTKQPGAPESGEQENALASRSKKTKHVSRNWQGHWRKTPGRVLGISLIRLYQLTLSGFIGHGCRHLPTCSEYAYEAIARHGLVKGGWLSLRRIAKCGPFGSSGLDPVPEKLGQDIS